LSSIPCRYITFESDGVAQVTRQSIAFSIGGKVASKTVTVYFIAQTDEICIPFRDITVEVMSFHGHHLFQMLGGTSAFNGDLSKYKVNP